MYRTADSGLNKQAQKIEEAQAEIRRITIEGHFSGQSHEVISALTQRVIFKCLRSIRIPRLKRDTYASLKRFAERQYRTLVSGVGSDYTLLAALTALRAGKAKGNGKLRAQRVLALKIGPGAQGATDDVYITDETAVALREYSKDYFDKRIKPTLDRLVVEHALDPNDLSGRNSLRNLAEMEVRYNAHLEQIAEFRAKGVKIVVSSVHADCSERCFPHQGKPYSLDGSCGVLEDGKPFEPLENATDIFYTTKAGRTYKNGLLGFNCRHTLYEYKPGMVIPHVTKERQKSEYAVNIRQRELESLVRNWEARADAYKTVDKDEYRKAMEKARLWKNEYKRYSRENGRAYYPTRLTV